MANTNFRNYFNPKFALTDIVIRVWKKKQQKQTATLCLVLPPYPVSPLPPPSSPPTPNPYLYPYSPQNTRPCFHVFPNSETSLLAAVAERRRILGLKLAAGEILFVIHFSLGLQSRKLQQSHCSDGSLLKISFCSLSIRTDSDQKCSRIGLSGEITSPRPIDRALCSASDGLCPIPGTQALEGATN